MQRTGVKAAVTSVVDETRHGIASLRGHHFDAPPANARIRRFFWPAAALVALVRAMWSDRETRGIYLRTMIPQLVVTLVAAVVVVAAFDSVAFDASGDTIAVKAEHGAKSVVALLASLYGALTVVEWIAIWLWRDAHDSISFHLAKLVDVPCDAPVKPKSLIAFGALYENLRRRIRAALCFAVTVIPATLAAYLASAAIGFLAARLNVNDALPIDDWRATANNAIPDVVAALVGAYWFSVFTIGKSALAWNAPTNAKTNAKTACEPLFVRALSSSKAPKIVQRYGRFARRVVGVASVPAWYAERAPWESAGLALARAIASLPGVYLLVRPLLSVASSMILVERAPECFSSTSADDSARVALSSSEAA